MCRHSWRSRPTTLNNGSSTTYRRGAVCRCFCARLVHSTGNGLTKVDFPGNDDAERPGWDGLIEATEGTPWIPNGRSGWEFGTNEDPKAKAENDFEKSVKALEKKEREETTFVFVTPRRWTGKTSWVTAKKAKSLLEGHSRLRRERHRTVA